MNREKTRRAIAELQLNAKGYIKMRSVVSVDGPILEQRCEICGGGREDPIGTPSNKNDQRLFDALKSFQDAHKHEASA